METRRQLQIGQLIKRNFSTVLMEEGGYIYGHDILVSVTHVNMTSDLGMAKIYLSVYNIENKQAVILLLEDSIIRLKQSLAKRIRKQVRRIPNIHVYLDETLDEMQRINQIFVDIKKDKD